MRRVPLAVALAAAMLLPTALAHVPHNRAFVQPFESQRVDEVVLDGAKAHVTLVDTADRLRDLVTHDVDPSRMSFDVEERENPSVADRDAIHAHFQIDRILLYHDANADGAWEPGLDTALKSWRFANYRWTSTGLRQVSVGGLTGVDDVLWTGTLGGAPNVTLEMVAAGVDLNDEGARGRPQDLLLYLTVPSLPARPVGSLYALEGSIAGAPGSSAAEERLDNLTLAAHVDQGGRRAYLDWGGQALVDGRDGNVTFALDAPAPGSETRAARWSLPLLDASFRMVMVSAVEYPPPANRLPGPELPLAGAGLMVAALLWRRR